jgi:hypothetical protein
MGHKGPVLRPRCIGPGRAWTHILFYSILCPQFHDGTTFQIINNKLQYNSFNLDVVNPQILIVQHLRKAVLRTDMCDRGPEVLPAITKSVMTSNHSKMSSHSTAGKTKTCTLNNSSEAWNNQKAWNWQKVKCDSGCLQHWIFNYLWHEDREGPIIIICGLKLKYAGTFQVADIKLPELAQLYKVL